MSVLEQMSAEDVSREMGELTEARREKLRGLKAAIEEGRYCVSSEVLAERLMERMLRR